MPRGVYERKDAPVASAERASTETVGDDTVHRTTPVRQEERLAAAQVGITYVALKPLKVEGVQVNPGELVPSAATWRNVHNYLSAGYLAVVKES